MSEMPALLRFSERKLWDESPGSRDVLARLARMREASADGDTASETRIGYLRAALDRLALGEFKSPEVMRSVAQSALDMDDKLKGAE